MCSKNIFFTLDFWVGLPQNLGLGFSVQSHFHRKSQQNSARRHEKLTVSLDLDRTRSRPVAGSVGFLSSRGAEGGRRSCQGPAFIARTPRTPQPNFLLPPAGCAGKGQGPIAAGKQCTARAPPPPPPPPPPRGHNHNPHCTPFPNYERDRLYKTIMPNEQMERIGEPSRAARRGNFSRGT